MKSLRASLVWILGASLVKSLGASSPRRKNLGRARVVGASLVEVVGLVGLLRLIETESLVEI